MCVAELVLTERMGEYHSIQLTRYGFSPGAVRRYNPFRIHLHTSNNAPWEVGLL